MIIARSEEEIDKILDYFVKDGFEGPMLYINKKHADLYYWKDCMLESFSKKGLLIFEPIWGWDNQENKIKNSLRWFSPSTLDEFIEE